MNKAMKILYRVHDNLYVNLTNRCPCNCTFCLRHTMDTVSHVDKEPLWLEHEPTYEEVVNEFSKFNMNEYKELVFCGFGEPTERLDMVLKIAKFAKETYNIKTRINTNGMSDLIHNRDTSKDFAGLIDVVSISLNTSNETSYLETVRPKFGKGSYQAMLKFAENVSKVVPEVVLSTVDTTISKEDEVSCQEICNKLGVKYRIRPFEI